MAVYLLDTNSYAEDIGLASEVTIIGKFDDGSLLCKTPSGLEIPIERPALELSSAEKARVLILAPMSLGHKSKIVSKIKADRISNRVSNITRKPSTYIPTSRVNEGNLMLAEAAKVNAEKYKNVWKLGELYAKAVLLPETRKEMTPSQYAKEVLNTDHSTAKRYALIYSRFNQYGLTVEDLTKIGSITKAHIIAEFITDESKPRLLELCKQYSDKKAFAVMARTEFASIKQVNTLPDFNVHNYRFQLTASQKEDIDAAVAIAAKIKGVHNVSAFDKGQLLSYIVCEWVKEIARQKDLQVKGVINDKYIQRVVGG